MADQLEELNIILFQQIKRLSSRTLTHKELNEEIDRSKAMAILASQHISSSSLILRKQIMQNAGNAKNIQIIEDIPSDKLINHKTES